MSTPREEVCALSGPRTVSGDALPRTRQEATKQRALLDTVNAGLPPAPFKVEIVFVERALIPQSTTALEAPTYWHAYVLAAELAHDMVGYDIARITAERLATSELIDVATFAAA